MEVSDIIEAVDMADYISQYCELEEKGGELWGLSPFKAEKTPSFSVNTQKKFWYDFSAGLGGNLLDFVMNYHNVDLIKAINLLKEYAGITDTDVNLVTRMSASRIARKYRHQSKPLREQKAAVLADDYMDRYELRKDKLKAWADEGIPWEVMKKFGVRYDAFDDRIVYPVRSYDGKIISICGRTCDPNYKEKGIRKYTYFQSLGSIDTLYAYFENKTAVLSKKEIIIFEGAESVMKACGWGFDNACALLTSHLSAHQFQFLLKLSSWHGVRIVFALDAEINITQDKNIMSLSRYACVEWIHNIKNLLDDKDSPVDKGIDVFKELYAGRRRIS